MLKNSMYWGTMCDKLEVQPKYSYILKSCNGSVKSFNDCNLVLLKTKVIREVKSILKWKVVNYDKTYVEPTRNIVHNIENVILHNTYTGLNIRYNKNIDCYTYISNMKSFMCSSRHEALAKLILSKNYHVELKNELRAALL